ncbi:hypothetical protein KI387_016692, partial [Taxus chinensis]
SKYRTLRTDVKLLEEHLRKVKESVKGAIGFKEKHVMLNKNNNTLQRIIKERKMDPKIIMRKKTHEDPSILSAEDAAREDKDNLENIKAVKKELVESGVICDSEKVGVVVEFG